MLCFALLFPAPLSGAIAVEGLVRTRSEVVLREFPPGAETDSTAFAEGLRRLRNMGIFSVVEGELSSGAAVVHLQEKWTTIPIFKAGTGGGVTTLTVGVFDPNVLGHYMELGTQYQRYGNSHSGVVWWREPRLGGGRLLVGGDFWYTHRPIEDYDLGRSKGWSGWRRMRAHLFAEPELRSDLVVHAALEYLADTLHPDLLPRGEGQQAALRPPTGARTPMASVAMRWGQVDRDLEIVRGWCIEPGVSAGYEWAGGSRPILLAGIEGLGYWLPHPRWNNAVRARWSGGSQRTWFHHYRLGGLEQLRGLPEGYYSGSQVWLLNAETRLTFLRTSWLRMQGVGFTDFGGTGARSWSRLYGGGVRLMSPRVYRLTLRMDYGHEWNGERKGVSAGLQQFF